MTREEIIAAIARNKINARDTRFDKYSRAMFRHVVRFHQGLLKQMDEELVA